MLSHYNLLLLFFGVVFLIGAFFSILSKKIKHLRLSVSLPMILVTVGSLAGYFWTELPTFNPVHQGAAIEKITEFVVLISLLGCGIKLDSPLKWKTWQPTFRLLLVAMPIGIMAMALLGYYVFGLSMAAALLLGAVLAPTDPVLAASIQVGPPNTGKEDATRFTLTSEAGLNDGLAFPFVYLAIALATIEHELPQKSAGLDWSMLGHWLLVDVVWRIAAGVVVGVVIGKLIAKWVFSEKNAEVVSQGFMAIALMFTAYGVAELVHGYGFISVFLAALMFRRHEETHDYHEGLHDFAEQTESLLMSLVMVFLGIALGQILASYWQITGLVYLVCLLGLLLIRPLAGWLSMMGLNLPHQARWAISALGIRGIGTFYYVAYASNKGVFSEQEASMVWVICSVMVVMSIFMHGLTANWLLSLTKKS